MARKVRDADLGTPRARLKLKALQRHWQGIQEGLALGYRRGTQGTGTWSVRVLLPGGRYVLRALGDADDRVRANGADVLSSAQAEKRAIAVADEMRGGGAVITPTTVAQAAEKYLAWFAAQPASSRAEKLGSTRSKGVLSALAILDEAFQAGAGRR